MPAGHGGIATKNSHHVYDIARITLRQNKITAPCHSSCCQGLLMRSFDGMGSANAQHLGETEFCQKSRLC